MATETRRDGIDLILTRYYAAPPEKLWQAWTDVDVLKTWFAPDPVKITEAVFDARPGGLFQITMLLPDGTEFSSPGCVIEAIPNRKLVFTELASLREECIPYEKFGSCFAYSTAG